MNEKHYEITEDSFETNYGEEIDDLIEEIYDKYSENPGEHISFFKSCAKKYPYVPEFVYFLCEGYAENRKIRKAKNLAKNLVKDFPDYFEGRLTLGRLFIIKKEYKEFKELFGDAKDISDVYPQRNIFMLTEVIDFHILMALYFVEAELESADNFEHHTKCLDNLQKQFDIDGFESLKLFKQAVFENKISQFEEKLIAQKVSVTDKPRNKAIQIETSPKLKHSVVEELYGWELDIEPFMLDYILELPHDTMQEDLVKLVKDSIYRYEYFKSQIPDDTAFQHEAFPMHALLLLAETKYENLQTLLLDLLEQGEDFLYFWFETNICPFFTIVYSSISQPNLPKIYEFLMRESISAHPKISALYMLGYSANKSPVLKADIVNFLQKLIHFYIENKNEPTIYDNVVTSRIVSVASSIAAHQLLPDIKKLYDENMVIDIISGSYEAISSNIFEQIEENDDAVFVGISDAYEKLIPLFYDHEYSDEYDEYDEYDNEFDIKAFSEIMNEIIPHDIPPNLIDSVNYYNSFEQGTYIKEFSTGRNDPCPCGSGKKYKKCCIHKQ